MEEWISRQEKQFSLCGILTCCRHTHVASNLLNPTKLLQPSPLRGAMLFSAELSRVNAVNSAKHTRIALKLIWAYTNFRKEMDFFPMKVTDHKTERNCIGRNWISAKKTNYQYEAFGQNVLREKPRPKSLFILERLWIFVTSSGRLETMKTSWTRLSPYFEYNFFSL